MVHGQRIPHAQLFFGAEGSGNLPMVYAFSRYLLCKNRTELDACGQCPACNMVGKLAHPDLHWVFPIAASKNVRVSADVMKNFRAAFTKLPYLTQQDWFGELDAENKQPVIPGEESNEIIKKLSITSYDGGFKVLIIWQPEKMNATSANKLLKMLEEPPDDTFFFLVTHHLDQILPTILSRTQLVKFGQLNTADLGEALQKKHALSSDRAETIARLADGNYREALQVLNESAEGTPFLAHFRLFMLTCLRFDVFKMNEWMEETAGLGREGQKYFLTFGLEVFREALLMNYGSPALVKMRGAELDFLKKFAPFVHMANYQLLTEEFNKACFHVERNANPKILFMDLALKVNELLNIKKGV